MVEHKEDYSSPTTQSAKSTHKVMGAFSLNIYKAQLRAVNFTSSRSELLFWKNRRNSGGTLPNGGDGHSFRDRHNSNRR